MFQWWDCFFLNINAEIKFDIFIALSTLLTMPANFTNVPLLTAHTNNYLIKLFWSYWIKLVCYPYPRISLFIHLYLLFYQHVSLSIRAQEAIYFICQSQVLRHMLVANLQGHSKHAKILEFCGGGYLFQSTRTRSAESYRYSM